MNVRNATPELLVPLVAQVLDQRGDARAIAVRAAPRWVNGDPEFQGRRIVVRPCTSSLAVRDALGSWLDRTDPPSTAGPDVLVVLCDLTDAELGADVLARVAGGRVFGLQSWNAVRAVFNVARLDPAFRADDGWIADALLEHVHPTVAHAAAPAGLLTRDLALSMLGSAVLGIRTFDVDGMIESAASGDLVTFESDGDSTIVQALLREFAVRSGEVGGLVAEIVAAGDPDQLFAVGLVCRAVYGQGDLAGGRDAGRLEARAGSASIAPHVGARLADRVEPVVRGLFGANRDRANEIIAAASNLATEVGAAHPGHSDFLPAGFEHRIGLVGECISGVLDAPERGAAVDRELLGRLREAVDSLSTHAEATTPAGSLRLAHAQMAARLAAWLCTAAPELPAPSFVDAATTYVATGAWVDWARRRLWRGDSDPSVGEVYRRLLDAVAARRRSANEQFARLLAGWTDTPADGDRLAAAGLVTVEDVLSRVVKPIADTNPVLLVVLDGCGLPTFVELAGQFANAGFRELASVAGRRIAGVAALPTVTEVSRASLLAGRLDRGDQDHERRQFESNAAIQFRSSSPPLYHQNRLLGPAGRSLSGEVERAILGNEHRVVGVVVNTIDDQLKRGDFAAEYNLRDLHVLAALLDAARNAGRVVVVSADHGHVLSQPADGGTGAFQGGGTGGERWRQADRAPGDVEVALRGTRVLLGGDRGVIAPWDDDFRYGARAGGYHGGATPEEVLVPVAAFIPAGLDAPAGWQHWTEAEPLWWDVRVVADTSPDQARILPIRRRKAAIQADPRQGTMFQTVGGVAPPTPRSAEPSWIAPLLTSAVWQAQSAAAGRANLREDQVRAVLAAVSQRGGVASFAAIAADSGVVSGRLPGFLVQLARVLNVDEYGVLDVDATAQEVRLVVPLLAQQFEIEL